MTDLMNPITEFDHILMPQKVEGLDINIPQLFHWHLHGFLDIGN